MLSHRQDAVPRLAVACLLISALALGGAAEAGLAASPLPPVGPPAPAALTWTRLGGMVEAFEGSVLGLVERGRDGYLALGRSQTTGLPRAWRSTDGLAWERIPLPPTTFGGGQPSALVWGPEGWVALGWRLTLEDAYQQVWLSADGVTWQPDTDPTGTLTTREEYEGPGSRWHIPWRDLQATDESVVILEGAPVPLRVSRDGWAWRSPVDPDGFGIIGSVDSGYLAWHLDALWRSTDGTSWSPMPPLPAELDLDSDWVAGPRGLLSIDGPMVGATTDGRSWTVSKEPSDQDYLQYLGWEGGWIAHADPVGDGVWYSADGANWTVGVISDPDLGRQWHLRLVSVDETRVLAVADDQGAVTAAWIGTFGPTTGAPPVTMTGPEPVDPVVDPNIVPLVRPPGTVCPPKPRTLRKLFRIPGWKGAVCFGDKRIRVVGPAFKTTERPGESGTAFDITLFVGASVWGYAPILWPGDYYGDGASDYTVIGRFVDRSCAPEPTGYPTPAAGLLDCQETFTPTSIRPVRR